MRKLIDYQHYVSTCPPLHSERLVVMMMFTQNAVRKRPVSEQFDRTVKVLFQPFGGDPRIGMIIQSFVDTGDRFHLLQHRADVVTDKDNGTFFINFRQQLVEACFETLVDIRAGFVQNKHGRVGDYGASQKRALQLSAA